MKGTVTYFESPGKVNTLSTLEIAKERTLEAGIKTVVLSSSGGYTASRAFEVFEGEDVRLIVIGFKDRFPEELAEKLKTALPKRLENLRELREKMGEAGPALKKRLRQRMMQQHKTQRRGVQQGPGRMGPGGRGGRQLRGRETRPSDEEIRKMIRQEIRRYLEEEATE